MKCSFEKALFVSGRMNIGKNIDRLYFGNEFCQNLIPDLKRLREWHSFAKKKGKGFTFVTPFVTDAGLDRLVVLFSFLNQQEDVEIVFNDWGVFYSLKNGFSNLIPILGRLLTKQRRDPRALSILSNKQNLVAWNVGRKKALLFPKKVPPELFTHYQASIINVPIFQKFLFSEGVRRVEIDNLIWKMNIDVPSEMGVSVYFPYGYISTGRKCWQISLSYASCKKECERHFFHLKDNSLPVPIYTRGNTIFYKSKKIDFEQLQHLKHLRIVYQPRLS